MSISFQGSLLGGNEFFWGDAEELGQKSEVTGDGMHSGNPPYKGVHHTICIHTLYFSYPFFAWSAICISLFVSVPCGHYHELLHLQA